MATQMGLDLFGDTSSPVVSPSQEEQMTLGLHDPSDLRGYVTEHATDDGFEATELPEPTKYEPGTWSKVEALAERLAKGQQLWHPEDAKRSRASQIVLEAFHELELITDED